MTSMTMAFGEPPTLAARRWAETLNAVRHMSGSLENLSRRQEISEDAIAAAEIAAAVAALDRAFERLGTLSRRPADGA